MNTIRMRDALKLTALTLTLALLAYATQAHAAGAPIKQVISSHLGWEVDKTTKGNVCTVESKDECQGGLVSTLPGGFENLSGVAVGANGNLYVADAPNQRVQEIMPSGEFVLMLGRKVDQTTGADLCTKVSKDKCGAGEEGVGPGQFKDPAGIVVDRAAHLVYLLDSGNNRVQEFTENGEFILMFGKEVNETKDKTVGATMAEKDVCTAASGNMCTGGVRGSAKAPEPYAFDAWIYSFNMLAVGGAEELLYVGNEHGVQEFTPQGAYESEVAPAEISFVSGGVLKSLAVDAAGDLYIVVEGVNAVYKFAPGGGPIGQFSLSPRSPAANLFGVEAVAVDSAGRVAVDEYEQREQGGAGVNTPFGSLLDGGDGHLITEFVIAPTGNGAGMTFGPEDGIYLAGHLRAFEVIAYKPKPVAELVPVSGSCVPSGEHDTDVTLSCSLAGEVNPWGVPDTEAWFEWGRTPALGSETPVQVVCTSVCGSTGSGVSFVVEGVRPGEGSFYYRLRGFDANSPRGEDALLSPPPLASFATPTVPPKIVGEAGASFVTGSSVLLSGVLNPESARTSYAFQYAAAPGCEARERELGSTVSVGECPGVVETVREQSSVYGKVGAVAEVTGLQPATGYRYRLVAANERAQSAAGTEGGFTTSSPTVVGARTGSFGSVTATSAVIAGIVEPDGQPVSYAFEAGVYAGAQTQYGIVSAGQLAGGGEEAVEVKLALSGLQPGTAYAYRLSVRYGDGTRSGWSATGSPVTFMTEGLPAVLFSPVSLSLLVVPSIGFPSEAKVTPRKLACRRGYRREKHGRCVRSKANRGAKGRRRSSLRAGHRKGGRS